MKLPAGEILAGSFFGNVILYLRFTCVMLFILDFQME